MTNTPSMNAQHPAISHARELREWKTPVLDILALEEAEGGSVKGHPDGHHTNGSA